MAKNASKPEAKTEPKTKAKPRSRIPSHESYSFQIEDWDVSYAISAATDLQRARAPYGEYLHLALITRMVDPERFRGRRVMLVMLGQREIDTAMNARDLSAGPGVHMGTLHMRGDKSEYLGVLPASVVWGLVPALEAGRIKVVQMSGDPLHHASASIGWIGFDRTFDEE